MVSSVPEWSSLSPTLFKVSGQADGLSDFLAHHRRLN